MHQVLNDIPLVGGPSYTRSVAVIGRNRNWTWGEVHAASLDLAARLDDCSSVCNLCDSYLGFLVTSLAAIRRGVLQILPPSRGNCDLRAALSSSDRPLIVVDKSHLVQQEWLEHSRCLVYDVDKSDHACSGKDLVLSNNWEASQICLFTSGSTGAPVPKLKTLGRLVYGAHVLRARIDEELDGPFDQLNCIVSSVARQHMFGIEATLMFSLVHGLPVLDRRPLLPVDIHDALNTCKTGAVWVATPLHLEALSRSGGFVPNCRVVITSTMALDAALALRAETLTNAPVVEVYGSTETGALAVRRTSRQESWRVLDGVQIRPGASEAFASGQHFESPQQLNDCIEKTSPGSFKLLGRNTDLIKVAGRRASLSGLNLLIRDMPGLTDAVFYMPHSHILDERLVLIYAGGGLRRQDIKAFLMKKIDPAFMPRVFIETERLPRTESGKLPVRGLDEVYDAWLAKKAGGTSA